MSRDNRSWGSLEILKNCEGSVSKWVLLDWLKIALFLDSIFNIVWTLLNRLKVLIITVNYSIEMLLSMCFLLLLSPPPQLLGTFIIYRGFYTQIAPWNRGHTFTIPILWSIRDELMILSGLLDVWCSACLWLQWSLKFQASVLR